MSGLKMAQLGTCLDRVETWNPLRAAPTDEFFYIDLSAVDQDSKRIIGARRIACSEAPSRARQSVVSGDLLMSTVRPNLNGVAQVTNELDGATASTGFCVLRANPDKLDKNYLFQWIKSTDFISDMVSKATGASYPAVSDRIIFESKIPLPPLPEQRRIAAILDQAETLRTQRHTALALLDTLTQSIFLEMFGDPARNTLKLPLKKLGELGDWHSGGTPPRSKSEYFSGEIPWYSSGELNSMYILASEECISETAILETSAKRVPAGSLLLGMYDTAALKSSISTVESSCNQAIAFASIEPNQAEVVYVYYAIAIGREHFKRLQRGVRQKNLNLSIVREIKIPAPPLHLQQTFATRIAAIEALKSTHRTALAQLDALFASLQHRAFSGQL
jgi:type I restriction enzyme, S subunit